MTPSGGSPGGLFWKLFLACWLSAVATGFGLRGMAALFPGWIVLPRPPGGGPSMGMPLATGALVGAVVSALLAWSLSRPIRLLRQAFHDAARGRLQTRLAPRLHRRHDEFAELAHDFDRMATQLGALLGAQRRLLHDVSHELRSPLARMQAALGLLHRDGREAGPTMERLNREIERLDHLVGEVLTLARLESGQSGGALEEVDLPALLAMVVEDARFEARPQGKDVALVLPDVRALREALLPARGELLLRAFENVVRNAVKFTAPGTRVEVALERDAGSRRGQDGWRIDVHDRGPGLAPELRTRIFEPFFRCAPAGSPEGFGLGLAIAHRALAGQGGRIEALPRDGGGLTMRIQLVASAPQAATA